MNFFQRYRAKQKEIESPPVEPLPGPNEEEIKTIDTVKPIRVSDAQYLLLTRALRPEITPVRKDLAVDVASQPPPANPRSISPDQPPGTPIV